jgi:FtsP/CotA-like multicopper oxidase with cupredoxin domain
MVTPEDETRTVGAIATGVVALIAIVLSGGALIIASNAGDGAAATTASSGTDTGESTAASSVEVDLAEFSIAPTDLEVAAGGTLEVTNAGSIEHDLEVVDAGVGTQMLAAGESASLALGDLAPGTYEVRCTVPGHDSAGMVTSLTIAGEGGSAEGEDPAAGGDHDADTDWAALDAAMNESILAFPAETETHGNQPLEPEEVRDDGTKVFRLVAEIFEWEIEPGVFVEGWGYNGQIPGPMIQVDVGDDVEVIVENELPLGTDVHWHGVRVPNEQDGVAPLTQDLIPSGESFTYRFTADEPAIGMYHPHHHGQLKLPNGMFGAFTIGDVGEDIPFPSGTVGGREVPADVDPVAEIPMILNDAGTIGLSLNGKSFPATEPIVVEEGDWFVIHYYNEGLQSHPMHLHQMPQLLFAKDGFPLDAPRWEDTINVAPGERFSVLVQATDPGVWVFHCHILTHAEREEGMFGMVTAVIVEEAA